MSAFEHVIEYPRGACVVVLRSLRKPGATAMAKPAGLPPTDEALNMSLEACISCAPSFFGETSKKPKASIDMPWNVKEEAAAPPKPTKAAKFVCRERIYWNWYGAISTSSILYTTSTQHFYRFHSTEMVGLSGLGNSTRLP